MATKKKKTVKKKAAKPRAKSAPASKAKKPAYEVTHKKTAVKIVAKKIKCCVHCPDYENCEDREFCCEYCDFYLNGRCVYGKKSTLPSVNDEIELPDYRGDDFGIDDYEAYESGYE